MRGGRIRWHGDKLVLLASACRVSAQASPCLYPSHLIWST
ncbi:hypothetical protein [Azospirillum palustre]